ncbi:MAG: hypothetical protein ACLT8E_04295 [Akkermansia sp.]
MSDIMAEQYPDVEAAVEQISRRAGTTWRAIEEWEILLAEKAALERVKEAKRNEAGMSPSFPTIPATGRFQGAQ